MLHKASTKCFQVPTTATCANTKSYFFDISAVTLAILPMQGGDLSLILETWDILYRINQHHLSA